MSCTDAAASPAETLWAALNQSQPVVEFDIDGTVRRANQPFLSLMGFRLDEFAGRHHRLFCSREDIASPSYANFWSRLAAGHVIEACNTRISKDGRPVYLQASYLPVPGADGQVERVVKVARDVTAERALAADNASKLTAINRAQALVEFTLDGHIIDANDNFLAMLGYRHDELVGRPHSILCDPGDAQSRAYRSLWQMLADGAFETGRFRRIGKGGREVWVQATYSPVFDASGLPARILKIASDITAQVRLEEQVRASLAEAERFQSEMAGPALALEGTMEGLGRIVGLINEIAARTEQLAVNASLPHEAQARPLLIDGPRVDRRRAQA